MNITFCPAWPSASEWSPSHSPLCHLLPGKSASGLWVAVEIAACSHKLSQCQLKHLSAILQQQQLVVGCCSPVPLFALSLTTPSAHRCRHQDHPLIMKWYGRLASWCVACSATDVGSKCNSTIFFPIVYQCCTLGMYRCLCYPV